MPASRARPYPPLASQLGCVCQAYSLATGEVLQNGLGVLPSSAHALTTSPNDAYVALGCEDGLVRVFRRSPEEQVTPAICAVIS